MKYVGWVGDTFYLSADEQFLPKVNPLNLPWKPYVAGKRINPIRQNRIYSDEVTLCRGMQAFSQMQRVFKMKHIAKWEAWRAWRALV